MQFTTLLHSRTPRVNCPEHGVKTVAVPWAGKHSRFTLLSEAFGIKVLEACRSGHNHVPLPNDLGNSRVLGYALSYFNHWLEEVRRLGIKEMKSVARMLGKHLANILAYFDTYITNAFPEGINPEIQ